MIQIYLLLFDITKYESLEDRIKCKQMVIEGLLVM